MVVSSGPRHEKERVNRMQHATLGNTGIKVSKVCMGAMSFGGEADLDMSARLFQRCREAGVNFFDTANVYKDGRSEEILGELIATCRDEVVITTKVGMSLGKVTSGGLSRRHIFQQVEQSLRRLRTDRIEVYFCHIFDPAVPVEVTLRAMDDLVRGGKVLHVGVSNWTAWQIALALGDCRQGNLAPIDVLQPMYNLAKRTAEIEILPLAADRRLGVITYSPLGGGLLSGKYAPDRRDPQGRLSTNKMYQSRYRDPEGFRIAQRLTKYAAGCGAHPVTLAVAWVKSHPAVTAAIIGARNLQQLEPSLAAGDYDMPPAQRDEITALTPPVPPAHDRTEVTPR